MTTAPPVGVIGLGEIGGGVARNLHRAGHEVIAHDVRTEALVALDGIARAAVSPAEVAALTSVVVVAVVDDAQVRDVIAGPAGILAAAEARSVIVVLSTIALATLRAMAERARAAGVDLVDCGVSGGHGAAERGQLVAMVGGDAAVMERLGPVFAGFTSRVVHMGGVGAGLTAKLARNLVGIGAWTAAYEGQRLAEAAGIELAKLADVIRASDEFIGGVTALMLRDTVAPLSADVDPRFRAAMEAGAALAHKDLRAALALAGDLGLDLPLTALAEATVDRVMGLE